MLKFIDDLDIKKPRLSKLCILPGFNIKDLAIQQFKHPVSNDFANKNTLTLDKDTISETMFSKLYGLIDTTKKQFTKKSHRKRQRKLTRKQ